MTITLVSFLPVRAEADDELLAELDQRVDALSTANLAESVPFAERNVALARERHGEDSLTYAAAITWLARLYQAQGRYAEAEPGFKQALAIVQKVRQDPSHLDVGRSLNRLAWLYREQGRYQDAEPLFTRVRDIVAAMRDSQHPDVAESLSGLAWLYKALGTAAERGSAAQKVLYDKAIGLIEQALPITEKALGPNYPTLAKPTLAKQLTIQVELYRLHGRAIEAEPIAQRALAIYQQADHPLVASALNELALVYWEQGRDGEAAPLFRQALEINTNRLGPQHLDVGRDLYNLAMVYGRQGDTETSLWYAREAGKLVAVRSRRMSNMGAGASQHQVQVELADQAYVFHRLIRSAWERAQVDASQRRTLEAEAFEAAQWSRQTTASTALAQMKARLSTSDERVSRLVRDRQDLAIEWQELDQRLIAAASQAASQRDPAQEQLWRQRLAEIDDRLKISNEGLRSQFPDYYAFANPEPLSITAVQGELNADEALVQFIFYGPAAYAWAITKTDSHWVFIAGAGKTVPDQVAALRCGLDQRGEWSLDDRAQRCRQLLGIIRSGEERAIKDRGRPFNLVIAYDLYRTLFGQIEDVIKGKHLLLVPSGPLMSLPFHVLLTQRPKTAIPREYNDYERAPWLAQSHAVTTLPSVASLQARRRIDTWTAPDSYIAFGNPLLTGRNGNDRTAWRKQTCSAPVPSLFTRLAGEPIHNAGSLFSRSGLANVAQVRRQPALPETADELCEVARSLGAKADDVYLGSRATERTVKTLSASGKLQRARVVHFATHGLLAGETQSFDERRVEPALILTPPDQASDEDDGLLTSSEVARLMLNADWVILSACNTAAGEEQNAEALSGFARAFFYAGARALLVSHWYVDSDATVALITRVFAELARDPKIGRAEALRRSMLALIKGGGRKSHPAKWAPFVVVGDSAR